MPSKGKPVHVPYFALDTVNRTGKTGDVANHTLSWNVDGVRSALTNTPTEIDATNSKGAYDILLTAAESNNDIAMLTGESSTSDIEIIPVTIVFEGYQRGLY